MKVRTDTQTYNIRSFFKTVGSKVGKDVRSCRRCPIVYINKKVSTLRKHIVSAHTNVCLPLGPNGIRAESIVLDPLFQQEVMEGKNAERNTIQRLLSPGTETKAIVLRHAVAAVS
jgi:hypothetical protein